MAHEVLLAILGRRIKDKRILHHIQQFLRAGYVEMGQTQPIYSGVSQWRNLSPILSNIYLNELEHAMKIQMTQFNRSKRQL